MKNNTTAADSTELKVADSTRELADNIRKEFKLGEGGVIDVPKDLLERHLPAGVTMADVKRVQAAGSTMISAVALATGEFATAAMKKDKKLASVSVEVPLGKDRIGAMFQRERQVSDGNGGQQTKFGVLQAKYTVAGARPTGGEYKRIRDHLSSQAAEFFGAK